jgi:hypothetical protein
VSARRSASSSSRATRSASIDACAGRAGASGSLPASQARVGGAGEYGDSVSSPGGPRPWPYLDGTVRPWADGRGARRGIEPVGRPGLIRVATDGNGIGDRAAVLRRLIAADPSAAEDLVGLLGHVCRVAAAEMAASGAGVSVMTRHGGRGLYAASDAVSERFEDLQFVLGEGPCIEAFEARRPVMIADLSSDAMHRWPLYAPAVHEDGLRAVFAFPLQVGAARLGVMDVFREQPGPLTEVQLGTAFLVADMIVEVLLDRQEGHGRQGIDGGLVWNVGNRAQLFQAQGMVMVQLGIPVAEAMVRMRAVAFAEGRRLDDVAADVVNGTLRFTRDTT